jgi:hypothetical protein
MKFSKEAIDAAKAYITSHDEFDIVDIIKILRDHTLFIDASALLNEACDKTARSLLAGIKDGKGVRSIFSDGSCGHFINLELTTDLKKIQAIKERAKKQAEALNETARRAMNVIGFIKNFIPLEEWLKAADYINSLDEEIADCIDISDERESDDDNGQNP